MDIEQFEQFVTEALADVPDPFRPYLDTVEIIVLPHPSRVQRRVMGLGPRETLYGLYEGVPVPERVQSSGDAEGGGIPPSRITLYRRSLAADFPNVGELRREVRRTVFHELAHHFGIDDDRLRELGAY